MDSSFNIQNYFKRGKTVVLTLRQGDSDEVRQWSDKDTSQLLTLMNESLPEFQNQRRRKKEVWADISKKLSDDGYCWTPEDCRKKWSNMVRTFKGIQEQRQDPSLSSKRIKWPFFEYMGDLLALDGADYLPEATSIVQLLNNPIQGPGSPTPNLSSKSHENRLLNEQSSSNTRTVPENIPDMVGVAVDLASIINVSSGDEVTLQDPLRPLEIEQVQTPTTVERMIAVEEGSSAQTQTLHGQQSSHSSSLKTVVRSEKGKSRKRVRTKSTISAENSTNPESMMERFITMTSKHNEALLEELSSFQENALELIQERNDILKRLCTVLEQQQSSVTEISDDGNAASTSRRYCFQDGSESVENDHHAGSNQEQDSRSVQRIDGIETTSYHITEGSTLVSATTEDGTNVDLNVGSGVDPESLQMQTLISQDSAGGITFHLDVPDPDHPSTSSGSNENNRRMLTDQKGQVRLENIPSDVNLSAFSATLPPYYVSVMPNSNCSNKPRFNLAKSISVPLHSLTPPGHRKIAPRK